MRTDAVGGKEPGLLSGYRPVPGTWDEMAGPGGTIRPAYRALHAELERLGPDGHEAGLRLARQYLREAGVFYRAGAEGGERLWPLALPPLVLGGAEWRALEAGLRQRADYLERLLADLYGERRVVREGILPAILLGDNPEFLRPLADQGASGRPLLRFLAIDLVRGPDGRWQVAGDRTQAPSGAGFALENRVATARAFPDLAPRLHVQRLAGFFARFRDELNRLNGTDGTARVGLLTPGPLNETYFEHAYLARYLGFHLLEGGDLAVENNEVRLRTVDGTRPVRVLWRRLDADYADPLELLSGSFIGTPGLVRAARAGRVELVNALGSGLLETPAFAAFETEMARALIGGDLGLRSAETRWEPDGGESPPPPGWEALAPVPRAADAPDADPRGTVLRRLPVPSTVPVFTDSGLRGLPLTLRVFLARCGERWEVMPGGLARVAADETGGRTAIGAGGRSLDVWVTGDEAPAPVTLLGAVGGPFQRRLPGSLPARTADNLFWLGRSAERLEVACRLWRAAIESTEESRGHGGPVDAARLSLLLRSGIGRDGEDPAVGLLNLARTALSVVSRIRDRFSPDGWRAFAEIHEILEEAVAVPAAREDDVLAGRLLTRLAGFAGLVHENMVQLAGWRFLQGGRQIERMAATAHAAASFLEAEGSGTLQAILDLTDSRMTYRRRFSVELSRETVLDLAILDPLNPRSLAFIANGLADTLSSLPGHLPGEALDTSARRAARLRVRLQTASPIEVDAAFLRRIAQDAADISNALTQRFFAARPTGAADRTGAE